MNQRSLDEEDPSEDGSPEPEEDPDPDAEAETEPSGVADPPPSGGPAPNVPRALLEGPSDAALRERQIAWMQERARHEERRRPVPITEGSK